ncbi:MAG: preprotein translocase subunit SecY [Bacteroidota bacterium]
MITSWFNTIKDIYQTKELRTRLYNTLFYVTIFRIGIYIVLPTINLEILSQESSDFAKFLDILLNSTALSGKVIFSLGISPYISASIITQITSLTIPYFQRLKKEGPSGRAQLNQITRYITFGMAIMQSTMYVGAIARDPRVPMISRLFFFPLTILVLTTGAMFCVWLADRITAKGLGSGSSVLITSNIASGLLGALYVEYSNKESTLLFFILKLLILLLIITITITFMQGLRKIPLQYATQMVGAQATYRGARQYLPIGLNTPGVMPIIFAQTITSIPLMIAKFFAQRNPNSYATTIVSTLSNTYGWQYNLILCTLIFMGSFFYATIFVNANEMADELKRSNGFIPGIMSGRSTAEYIDEKLSKITLPGSLFLVGITLIPVLAKKFICYEKEMCRYFGGTSQLITIGVILDIGKRIESYLFDTYYKGMLKAPHAHLLGTNQ